MLINTSKNDSRIHMHLKLKLVAKNCLIYFYVLVDFYLYFIKYTHGPNIFKTFHGFTTLLKRKIKNTLLNIENIFFVVLSFQVL